MKRLERRTLLTTLAGLPLVGLLGGAAVKKDVAEMTEITKAPKFRGVVYDVGLNFTGTGFSVEPFSPALVEHDLRTIKDALHCTAVRIEGEEISRLVTASRIAHKLGLTVFFNPWYMNADAAQLLPYFAEAAEEAEKLKKEGVDIVFVAGCEYPIFNKGIIPGDTLGDRLSGIGAVFGAGPEEHARMWAKLNVDLKSFVDVIRPKFSGPVTYAATQFEQVDWSIFDIVGIDHYRAAETAEKYVEELDKYRLNKPLVVMEVGSCAYVGAAKLGGGGFMVLEGTNPDGTAKFKDGIVPTRSEAEQAGYVEEQVRLVSNAGVDGVFIYVFSFPLYPVGEGVTDLDMVGYSLVKTYPDDDPRSKAMPPWAPKEAFHRLAGIYQRMKTIKG